MIRIIRTSSIRQLHAGIDELHSRWVSERTRACNTDHRITQALAILDGQEDAQAEQLRAVSVTIAKPENVLTAVLTTRGAHCSCEGACGKEHTGKTCMAGATGRPVRLTAAPYPPYATDVENAAAPLAELRPWCGPCWRRALARERDRVADQRRRELEESQILLFDIDRGAAA